MSFLERLLGREERSHIKASDPYLGEFFGQRGGGGGFANPQRASGLAVANACISIISQNLAAVPCNLYQRTPNGGREKAHSHPLFKALHDSANESQTAFEVREAILVSLLISGNAYAEIKWNAKGQAERLIPIDSGSVTPEKLTNGRIRYRVSTPAGPTRTLVQEEMLHLRYRLGPDGLMGLSPIQIVRETFNLALSQNDQAYKLADKGFRPAGALVFPEKLGRDFAPHIKSNFREKFLGAANTGEVMVLDGGAKFESISFNSRDSEFLESRKLSNLDICRAFGVPPTVAGITDNATYSNSDQESRALVVRCLAPMARRVEQAMNTALLPPTARKSLFIEHDLAGLMRGDMKARYEAYRVGREWGWLSPNEIRGWENLPEIDGGDEFLTPLNMTSLNDREAETDEK